MGHGAAKASAASSAGLTAAVDAAGPCTPAVSIEALTPVSSAVSFAVARVGVGADCPCEVKGFTAQIPGHTERCGGDAGYPGGPRGMVTGETGKPRRQEQRKPD